MTALEQAEAALAEFKKSMKDGHPWMPGMLFVNNPGLDRYILVALEEFRMLRALEQVEPDERVSLSDDPDWRPSCVAPVSEGKKALEERLGMSYKEALKIALDQT